MIKCDPPKPTVTTNKVKTRGHWSIMIRPCEFESLRIGDISALPKLATKTAVSLRGWDFPHVGRDPPSIQGDWIRSEVDWDGIVESWVLFQSGLFHFLGGYRDDWRDESSFYKKWSEWQEGKFLNVHDTIFKLVEIYEFAARLATALPGTDPFRVTIALDRLEGRHLYMSSESNRHMRWQWFKSEAEAFKWEEEIERTTLLAQPKEFATKIAINLFKRFTWEDPERVIREIQNELRAR